jgi:tRNA A37 methylthiotransferase MiaB
MKRQYEPEEFKRLVRRLRSRIPNLTLSTDIIVGYPTETDEDFQSTIDLITETRPDITNISKYGPRPRTEAAKLTPLPANILSARSRTTTSLGARISLERNQRMIGKREEITPVDTTSRGRSIGRTHNYKKTIIDEKAVLGTKIPIKVTKAFPRHLEAVVLDQHTHAQCHHQECTAEM